MDCRRIEGKQDIFTNIHIQIGQNNVKTPNFVSISSKFTVNV